MLEPSLPDNSSREVVGKRACRIELDRALGGFVTSEFVGELRGGVSSEE